MMLDIKSVKITEKGQIVLPKILRECDGFKTGDKLGIITYSDHVELRPLADIERNMQTAHASEKSLSKEWNSKKEDKAWKDL